MFRLRYLLAACLIAILAAPLSANEIPSLREQQRAVLEQIAEVSFFEFYRKSEPNWQTVTETLQLLRDSESLFPESDEEESDDEDYLRGDYIDSRTRFLVLAAIRTKDAEKKAALFDEAEKVAMMFADPNEREYALEELIDMQQHGILIEGTLTVEDALKIQNLQWREEALHTIAERLSKQTPPDFAEALRAAQLKKDRLNGESCLSLIAVRQARAGLFDDAEATYRLIAERDWVKRETLFTFVVIHEQQGNIENAKRWIDEAFKLGYAQKDAQWSVTQFLRYCHSCITQLNDVELIRYIFDKMLALKNEGDAETQRILTEFREGIRTQHSISKRNDFTDALTFAQVAARLGDKEQALRYFGEAKSLIADEDRVFDAEVMQHNLIATLFETGFHAEAQKELDDYILIPLRENRFTRYPIIPTFLSTLNAHGRFTEIVTIVKAIPDDEERFKMYDFLTWLMRQRFPSSDMNERVQVVPPLIKPFSSPQEMLDIAEMLTDEPDGRSLESLRNRIRRYAERLAGME